MAPRPSTASPSPGPSSSGGFNSDVAFQVNERNELLPNTTVYIEPRADANSADVVILEDPIDNVPHPYLERVINTKYQGDLDEFVDLTMVSARERHFIIAENALANGDTGPGSTFCTQINAPRSLDGLSAYAGQIPSQDILEASRQAHLYLQGRRLTDMYRFGILSPQWKPSSECCGNSGHLHSPDEHGNPVQPESLISDGSRALHCVSGRPHGGRSMPARPLVQHHPPSRHTLLP